MKTTRPNQQRKTMTYHVTFERDAKSFWDANASSLLAHESGYNLMIGLTLGIISFVWNHLALLLLIGEPSELRRNPAAGKAQRAGSEDRRGLRGAILQELPATREVVPERESVGTPRNSFFLFRFESRDVAGEGPDQSAP